MTLTFEQPTTGRDKTTQRTLLNYVHRSISNMVIAF